MGSLKTHSSDLWESINQALVKEVRQSVGRAAEPSLAIMVYVAMIRLLLRRKPLAERSPIENNRRRWKKAAA